MMVKGGLASDYPSGAAGRAGAAFDADDDNDADLGEEYEEGKRLKEVRACGGKKCFIVWTPDSLP